MIGLSLGITALRGAPSTDPPSLAFLFANEQAGFWVDSYEPPPFDPAQLFGPSTAGHYAGGYAPPAFDPSQLFGSDTPGFYVAGYEASL